jgi:hypothetical protein
MEYFLPNFKTAINFLHPFHHVFFYLAFPQQIRRNWPSIKSNRIKSSKRKFDG